MAFFTQDFLDFFKDLEENNERDWYHAHKKRYYKSVKEPFAAFVGEMIDRLSAIDPHMLTTPKESIFRIARDIRFSNDKTPYKTHAAAVIGEGGRKGMRTPGVYIQFSAKEAGLYSGVYQPPKEDLQNIREAIAAEPDKFADLLQQPKFVEKTGGTIEGERNKRIPKEFKEAAEQQPLIYQKTFLYQQILPPETLLRDDLPDIVTDFYLAVRPMNQFFTQAIQFDE